MPDTSTRLKDVETMKPTMLAKTVLCLNMTALILSGCGSDGVDYGPTGTVQGTVKLDEKAPAEKTQVTFLHPAEGYSATGYTDSEGKYKLTSWNSGNLPAGDYKVFVMPPEPKKLTPEEELERGPNDSDPEPEFDEEFSDAETSGLTFTVKEGENTFDVELSK